MATYKGTEAVDYNKLNPMQNNRNTAPKIVPLPVGNAQQQVKPKIVRKTRQQIKAETRRANLRALKALGVAAILLGFVGVIIFSRIKVDELNRNIQSQKAKLDVLNSQNTALEMKMNSMVSLDKVEEYAENQLGMVKQEAYQVEYVDLTDSEKVLVSGGKKVDKPSKSEDKDTGKKVIDKLSNISRKK